MRFPLGVYCAQSAETSESPEWPPHPLRVIGAFLAAAHERPEAQPAVDRVVLERLCSAAPPTIIAPHASSVGSDLERDEAEVFELRGPSRWAPVNYVGGRPQAAVSKVGVAIGDRPVHLLWPDLDLTAQEQDRMALLAGEVTFVGTSRSPALVEVGDTAPSETVRDAWRPTGAMTEAVTVAVRVPDETTLEGFDRRHAMRSGTKEIPERTGMIPGARIGRSVAYARESTLRAAAGAQDPGWWGAMLVLGLDRSRSEIQPKAAAAYLVARAVRVALLGAFDDEGTAGEAPAILTARGDAPHCAFVSLPHVRSPHADGRILGVAVVLPSDARVPDLLEQRARLEQGLHQLVVDGDDERRYVRIPGAGTLWLESPDVRRAGLATLSELTYRRPACRWVTATPVVHSRWRKGGAEALLEQVTVDCRHVGLPAPERVEVLRAPVTGAARALPPSRVPLEWRGPLNGPTRHLRLTFERPVVGPLLIGRARHFGLGLLLPEHGRPGGEAT